MIHHMLLYHMLLYGYYETVQYHQLWFIPIFLSIFLSTQVSYFMGGYSQLSSCFAIFWDFPMKNSPPHDFGSSRNSPSKAQLPRAWCSFSASSAFARRKSALGCSGSCQRLGIDLAAAMGVKNGLRLAKVRIHIFLKTLFITFILKNKTPTTYYRQSIYI